MNITKFKDVTIVTAERNRFLKLKGNENSINLIGKPIRIIFSNTENMPEFEEEFLNK